jgi:hypothetical protein
LQTICLGWPQTSILPISASQLTRLQAWGTGAGVWFLTCQDHVPFVSVGSAESTNQGEKIFGQKKEMKLYLYWTCIDFFFGHYSYQYSIIGFTQHLIHMWHFK